MTDKEKLKIALDALRKIANCPEHNCEKYVAKVDLIALDALVEIENADIWHSALSQKKTPESKGYWNEALS